METLECKHGNVNTVSQIGGKFHLDIVQGKN